MKKSKADNSIIAVSEAVMHWLISWIGIDASVNHNKCARYQQMCLIYIKVCFWVTDTITYRYDCKTIYLPDLGSEFIQIST